VASTNPVQQQNEFARLRIDIIHASSISSLTDRCLGGVIGPRCVPDDRQIRGELYQNYGIDPGG